VAVVAEEDTTVEEEDVVEAEVVIMTSAVEATTVPTSLVPIAEAGVTTTSGNAQGTITMIVLGEDSYVATILPFKRVISGLGLKELS
jgi:hypothetical protein